ncbi:hypothetical protein FACS1894188_09330 [Clostridia bacterium]|nr:hypothetical protein FACS1894188_09330 [Clostridia bacterium]
MSDMKTIDGYTLEDVVKSVVAVLKPDEVREAETFDGYIPEGTIKEYKDIENYPPIMQAKHIKEFLGISEAFAYEVLNSANCPTLRIGKRMVISKESFLRFLQESEGKQIL